MQHYDRHYDVLALIVVFHQGCPYLSQKSKPELTKTSRSFVKLAGVYENKKKV